MSSDTSGQSFILVWTILVGTETKKKTSYISFMEGGRQRKACWIEPFGGNSYIIQRKQRWKEAMLPIKRVLQKNRLDVCLE